MGTTRPPLTLKRGHHVPLTSPQHICERFVKPLTLSTVNINSAEVPTSGHALTRAAIGFVRPASHTSIYINRIFFIYIYLHEQVGHFFSCRPTSFCLGLYSCFLIG